MKGPQAKPLLVRLSPFRLNIRPGRSAHTVRDEVLAVLPELIDEHGEFTMRDLLSRLNPEGENRRRWAVEKAVWRLVERPLREATLVTRRGPGLFTLERPGASPVQRTP